MNLNSKKSLRTKGPVKLNPSRAKRQNVSREFEIANMSLSGNKVNLVHTRQTSMSKGERELSGSEFGDSLSPLTKINEITPA